MNDSAQNPRDQIVEKLKSANNILVTVSADPSIDQLSACIATTLMLNKFKKDATAVFSGKVPTALNFLNPKKTIERTTDSLRDFIIALDKSKADKLRYKLEDDVVKIFITPYRTSITQKDLTYSAGDFNVDVILALGVHHQQDLDRAITAHGRIFHDAVVMSINNVIGGDLGVANWEDTDASSLSELVYNLSEALSPGMVDTDIATALLTGIVAETSRFSNEKTHPRTMNVSSKLLEAGADQLQVNLQLQDIIGTVVNLEAGTEIHPTEVMKPEASDVAEELVIDENGTFNHKDDALTEKDKPAEVNDEPKPDLKAETTPADADKIEKEADKPAVEADMHSTVPANLHLPDLATPAASPDTVDAISLLQEPDAPAVDTVDAPVADAGDQDGAKPPAEPFDLQSLLENQASEPSEPTDGARSRQSPDMPHIEGLPANQPSYGNPATTTQYDLPAKPEHEPAPLSMSPADQAFTMPMPPGGGLSQAAPAPQPGFQLPPQPQAGPIPPPLPPPVMPPTFNGQSQ
ncbi:MAG TPA: hypothetical protein VF572_05400 [Candidatus Saccharimonadales bacterium]|jgi:hypothetical protein